MNQKWLVIKQLDKQLNEWQAVNNKYGRPRAGWVKTLRLALSMTAEQLATRLGLKRASITQLERAEIHDSVTLRSLRQAADALDCDLIYAIVPKNSSSLKNIIKTRSKQVASEKVSGIAHTMSLESQTIFPDTLKEQRDELAESLARNLNKKLWIDTENKKKNFKEKD